METKLKKLEFYQNIIARMNTSSMQIKVACYTISSVILASDKNPLIVLLPVVILWILDSYYLANEKGFRCLYDETVNDTAEPINLEISPPFSCKCGLLIQTLKYFYSITMLLSYIPILSVIAILYFKIF